MIKFIQPIMAVAGLTLRVSRRTGILYLMLLLLPGGIIGLRFLLRGDATPIGEARLWLTYAAGWTVFLLSACALAVGAAAISLESAARRLQLVRVKPVSALQIWLGHWLGIMGMLTALLLLAGITIGAGMKHITRTADLPEMELQLLRHELLSAQIHIIPEPVNQPAIADDTIDPAVGVTVAPGGINHWRVKIPAATHGNQPARLRFEFITAQPGGMEEFNGLWTVGPVGDPRPQRLLTTSRPQHEYWIELPGQIAPAGTTLEIGYANIHSGTQATLLFPRDTGLILFVPAGNYISNLIRAGLMILARLAFFTALGLTAGAAFSFPVALFAAISLPLLDTLNRLQGATGRLWLLGGGGREEMTWTELLLDYAIIAVSHISGILTPSLADFNPRIMLVEGQIIPWGMVGEAGTAFLIYSALLAGAGVWALARR